MAEYKGLSELYRSPLDSVFHLAWGWRYGAIESWRTQLDSLEAACELLEQVARIGAKRFVFCGTNNEHEAAKVNFDIASHPRATMVYSASKLAADLLLKTIAPSLGIDCVTAMPAIVYGPGGQGGLAEALFSSFVDNTPPRLVSEDIPYDFVYIDDVVRALLAISDSGVAGTSYYVGHEDIGTVGSWARAFRDVCAPGLDLGFGEYPYEGGVDFSQVDTGRLVRETGFRCESDVSLTARKTLEWVRRHR